MSAKRHEQFFQRLIEVVNNAGPLKTVRIKNTSSDLFDMEIEEKFSITDKLKPSQHRLGNLQRGKKCRSKNNQTEEKKSILRRNCRKI